MPEVAKTQTAYTRDELVGKLCDLMETKGGAQLGIDLNVLAAIYSLIWLETSGAPLNNNFGNIIATSESQDYWVPPWVYDETHPLYGQAGVPDKFRSYATATEGLDALFSLLQSRYFEALQQAALGDFRGFSEKLLELGYCPDCSEPSHADTIESLANQVLSLKLFEKHCPPDSLMTYPEAARDPSQVVGQAYRVNLGPQTAYSAAIAASIPLATLAYFKWAKKPRPVAALAVATVGNLALVGITIWGQRTDLSIAQKYKS